VTTPLGAYRRISESKSIMNSSTFENAASRAVKDMKDLVPHSMLNQSNRYIMLRRYARHLIRSIPHMWYEKSRILSPFGYKIITYSYDDDQWKVHIQNPFKPIF